MRFIAELNPNSPRAADWRKVYGGLAAPILSTMPLRASLPGIDSALVYMLDLDRIDDRARARLIDHLALKFGVPADEVGRDLEYEGVPILAEDVIVVVVD